jgi:hypothetical protein
LNSLKKNDSLDMSFKPIILTGYPPASIITET